jgi:hypothetical protein
MVQMAAFSALAQTGGPAARSVKSLLGRRRLQAIDVGQRFRKAESANIVWLVSTVFQGVDGKRYAQLLRIDDKSMRKTVALDALIRSRQYLPVEPAAVSD